MILLLENQFYLFKISIIEEYIHPKITIRFYDEHFEYLQKAQKLNTHRIL
jgi:hypothetical protein